MFGSDLLPAARRAPRPVVRARRPMPIPGHAEEVGPNGGGGTVPQRPAHGGVVSDRDHPLLGLWGWFVASLRPEYAGLKAALKAAEEAGDADAAAEAAAHLESHRRLRDWAEAETHRRYLEDLRELAFWDIDAEYEREMSLSDESLDRLAGLYVEGK